MRTRTHTRQAEPSRHDRDKRVARFGTLSRVSRADELVPGSGESLPLLILLGGLPV